MILYHEPVSSSTLLSAYFYSAAVGVFSHARLKA